MGTLKRFGIELTYENMDHWKDKPPSMDEKHIPSPPQRTVEEYERDKALSINSLPHWRGPIDNVEEERERRERAKELQRAARQKADDAVAALGDTRRAEGPGPQEAAVSPDQEADRSGPADNPQAEAGGVQDRDEGQGLQK